MPQTPSWIFIANADKTIKVWDPNQAGMQPQTVGSHDEPVKDVYSFNVNG